MGLRKIVLISAIPVALATTNFVSGMASIGSLFDGSASELNQDIWKAKKEKSPLKKDFELEIEVAESVLEKQLKNMIFRDKVAFYVAFYPGEVVGTKLYQIGNELYHSILE